MKKILGSLLFFSFLFGAHYKVELSKAKLYVKEPLHIKLHYFTNDKREITWIKFEPKPSKDYEIHVLSKVSLPQGYEFHYLLFPLHSGKIDIEYLLELKRAPIQEIQNKILGTGYEQTTPIEGTIYTYDVNASLIDVKDAQADLYGTFDLQLKTDKQKAKVYEPVYVTINLQGVGYPPNVNDPLPQIKGVEKLSDKPQKKIVYKKDGAHITYTFNYALIADHSFKLPPLSFKVFDFHSYHTLKTDPLLITIEKVPPKADNIDSPKHLEPSYKALVKVLKIGAIFVAGFLSGILVMILFGKKFQLLFASKQELLTLIALRYPNSHEELKEKILKSRFLLPIKIKLLKERA